MGDQPHANEDHQETPVTEELSSLVGLLTLGQFDQIIVMLQKMQVTEGRVPDPSSVALLKTASHLASMCQQLTQSIDKNYQAWQESVNQQQMLQDQLADILTLLKQQETAVIHHQPPIYPLLQTTRPPPATFWQKLRTLFGQPSAPPQAAPPLSQNPPAADPRTLAPQPREDKPRKEPRLVIYCFGTFRVFQNKQPIENWQGQKGIAILKYLVTHRGKPIPKEVLMETFWPDADLEAARRNLHQAVYALRQTLRQQQPKLQHIRYENDSYMLNPKLDMWVDYEAFEEHVKNGRYLEANNQPNQAIAEFGIAEGLYQGNFLEENLYDDWAARPREYMLNQYLRIADRLVRYYQQQGEYTAAIALCHRLLNLDSCYEPAHRQLMACFLAQGQRHLAVRQYQTCVQTLQDELGLEPDEKTADLYLTIS